MSVSHIQLVIPIVSHPGPQGIAIRTHDCWPDIRVRLDKCLPRFVLSLTTRSTHPVPPMKRSGAMALVIVRRDSPPRASSNREHPQSRREMANPWLRSGGETSKTIFAIPLFVNSRPTVRPDRSAPIVRTGRV
jgi:hypothetical protein